MSVCPKDVNTIKIRDFNEILSFGDKLLGLRVYVPYKPCDRIGTIIKVTKVSIIYEYTFVHKITSNFSEHTGRINFDNCYNCVIENLRSMLFERKLQEDKSVKAG